MRFRMSSVAPTVVEEEEDEEEEEEDDEGTAGIASLPTVRTSVCTKWEVRLIFPRGDPKVAGTPESVTYRKPAAAKSGT